MTSHITLMSLLIRLTGLYNHESLLKIFDYEIDLTFPILQFVRKNHYIEDEKMRIVYLIYNIMITQ